MKKLLLIVAILLGGVSNSFASHVMGADITYTCLGGNVYQVTLTLYRDCSGAGIGTTSQNVNFTSSCGTQTVALPWVSTTEVSQLCPTAVSECNGGTQPGTEQYIFTGQVTLTPCVDWIMSWSLCCRNAAITNLVTPSSRSLYVQTTMNSILASCNNSPQFFQVPTPYLCANNLAIYNHAAADIDGDSLYYSFNTPLTTPGPPGTPIPFTAGYTLLQPLLTTAGMNLDQLTGEMCFTPSTNQVSVISVLIQEYRNGVLIGTQIREMQVVVTGCTNQNPTSGASASCGGAGGMTITSQGPSVTQIDSNSILMCPGDLVCFEVIFSDPDGDNITVTTNLATAIPNATWTIVNNGTPNPIGTFCWTPTPLDSGLNVFAIILVDDACPVTGTQTFTFDITVYDQPYAGPDQIICGNQSAQLNASGGGGFTWTVISGDPIVLGTNFSCNPCSNPLASPAVTTTYLLTSTLTSSCINVDTVTIKVVTDFTLITTQNDTGICLGETIDFTVTTSPPGNYNYSWIPPGIMTNPNGALTTGLFNTSGTNMIIVEVDTNGGCVKSDTLYVNVSTSVVPNITILTPDTTLVCITTLQIDLDLGGGIPTSCGPSPTNTCSSAATQTNVGVATGANSTTSWPAPYGNWYRNARHQFLYTAAELNAMGIIGGKITEIAWEITQINGTTTYNSYQMKMGCTSTASLSTWETGLTQVLNPVNINVAVGINVHVLDVAYEWDGVSNLVIEICYDNLAVTYTQNSITPWTTTTFTSSIYYRSDSQPACPITTTTGTSTNRPVTRFTWCPTAPDPNMYWYDWTPGTTLNDSTIQNPIATPNGATQYIITVTDTLGGCVDSDTINVYVGCCLTQVITSTDVTCGGGNDGQIIVSVTGANPNFIIAFYDSLGTTLIQSTPNVLMDSLNNIVAGTYIINITDMTGCTTIDTVVITEPLPLIITSITSDTTVCINSTSTIFATFTGGTPVVTANWDNGLVGNGPHIITPTGNTIYTVTVVDAIGCTVSDSIWVLLFDVISPAIITSNAILKDSICPGDSVVLTTLSPTGGSGVGYNYSWYNGNNVLVDTGLTTTVFPAYSGEIFSVVVGDDCTTPLQTVTLPIYWAPVLQPSYTTDTTNGCFPIAINLTNTTPNSYLIAQSNWDFGDGTNVNFNNPTILHNYNSPGCYDVTLTITSIYGCVTDTIMPNMQICAYPYPRADFSINPQPADYLNTEITFTNESYNSLVNDWIFSFGTPATSTETNPVVIFPPDVPGVYPTQLIVTNQFGCKDSITMDVIIDGIYLFYVPNAFTPDGDGVNEIFRPYGEGIDFSQYTMEIFDRWGELVFSTDNAERGWDGTYKGKTLSVGTYVWKIIAKEKYTSIIHDNYGHVNLIR